MNLFTDKLEFFDGAIRFNLICLILDILLLSFIIIEWYLSAKKSGWKLDIFHFIILRFYVFPVLLLYPFHASIYNSQVVGQYLFDKGEPFIDFAFLITISGLIFIYLGWHLGKDRNIIRIFNALFKPIILLNKNNIQSSICYFIVMFLGLSFLLYIIFIQIKEGFLFNPRAYFHSNNSIRPIYNLTNIFYPMLVTWTGLRYIAYKRFYYLFLTILLCLAGIFLGSRGAILEIIVIVIIFAMFYNYKKIQLKKIALIAVIFMSLAILLNMLRHSASSIKFSNEIFYGNSFSDTRDFGLVLGMWDCEFLYGKTYLAGLMSFIPRSLSEFRNEWGLGVFTARTCGFDPLVHPGLRPGMFGESYFNFGILGVALCGIIMGLLFRFVDNNIRIAIEKEKDVIKSYAYMLCFTFLMCFSVSIGFAAFYVMIITTISLAIFRQTLIKISK